MADFHGGRERNMGVFKLCMLFLRAMLIPKVRLATRELGTTTTSCGVQAVGQTPEVTAPRPGLLGVALQALAELACRTHHRASEKPSSDGIARDSSCIGAGNPEKGNLDVRPSNAKSVT